MIIKINVDYNLALSAIVYELTMSGKIKSKKSFKDVVTNYIHQWGESTIDDHREEGEDFLDEAEDIMTKYFKE